MVNSDGTHEKIASQPDKDVPGPGSYKANHDLVTPSFSVTFGNGPSRPSPTKPGAEREPAPNAYNREAKTPVMRKAPAFGFGVSSRPQTQGTVPGPGTYKTSTSVDEGPKVAFKGKIHATSYIGTEERRVRSNPGPGTYNARFPGKSPSCTMGASKRDDIDRYNARCANFPPPDAYKPNYKIAKVNRGSWSFGAGARPNLAELSLTTPAPNAYKTEKMNDGPKVAFKGKIYATSYIGTEEMRVRANPGPGTYRPDYKKALKSNGIFSFQGKPSTSYETKVPGPGTYTNQFNKSVKSAPSWSFLGTPSRNKAATFNSPGPGTYKVPCDIGNLPQYTMARSKGFADV